MRRAGWPRFLAGGRGEAGLWVGLAASSLGEDGGAEGHDEEGGGFGHGLGKFESHVCSGSPRNTPRRASVVGEGGDGIGLSRGVPAESCNGVGRLDVQEVLHAAGDAVVGDVRVESVHRVAVVVRRRLLGDGGVDQALAELGQRHVGGGGRAPAPNHK